MLFRATTLRATLFTLVIFAVRLNGATLSEEEDHQGHPTKDWPTVGGDLSNTRHSALAKVDKNNVRQLGGAWVSERFDDGSVSLVTPVAKDGVLFVTAGRKVYALNAITGVRIWTFSTAPDIRPERVDETSEALKNSTITEISVPNRRGIAIGQGLVFVGLHDGRVIALNKDTGELVWSQQTGVDQPKKEQVVSGAPIYSRGLVFVGLSNGDARLRGRVTAMDAATGKIAWQLFTVPAPGETGHETWPSFNDAWKFGGGGVWTNAAVDEDLGMVYFATGNAVPPFAGDWRPGSNLYTCSVLALEIKTGKLRWYYQLVRHDVFDADVGTPVILHDAQIEGQLRKAVAILRADGHLFQLDRVTGHPLRAVEERAVPQLASQKTVPTQPFPVGAESILMDCDDWKKEGVPAGFVLGCMWTSAAAPPPSKDPQNVLAPFPSARVSPMAYSPETRYFYAQATSFLTWPRRSPDPYYFDFDRSAPGLREHGELAAIDSRTGRIAWKRRVYAPKGAFPFLRGGLLTTSGGLLFRSAPDGTIEASDAQSGRILWTFQTGMAGAYGSPVTYEADGEQYVAVPMGPSVWAFKLGGELQTTNTAAALPKQEEAFFGPVIDTADVETTSLKRSSFGSGTRYFVDEFAFHPYRSRVEKGAKVRFVNNGKMEHEIVALDGSWSTGRLRPTQESWISFRSPGEHTYICKDHPWSYGQVIVTEEQVDQ
ncbi:outer membrane protein assembly factor BamB family protein [Steroidobacter gossypii]